MAGQPGKSHYPRILPLRREIGRKLIHLLGLILPLLYVVLGAGLMSRLMLFASLLLVGADLARIYWPPARRFYARLFGKLTRSREERRLSGASVLLIGQTATVLFFPPTVVPVAMTFGVLGDSAAAIVGTLVGRGILWRKDKSVAGSAACLAASFLGGIVWRTLPVPVVFAGAFAATLAEGLLARFDDNLTIPLFGGLVMWLLSG